VSEEKILARRAAERDFPPGYRTFREPGTEVARTLRDHPLLAKNIEEQTEMLRELKLRRKTNHPATIEYLSPLPKRTRLARHISNHEKKMIAAVWNRMNDPEAAASYVRVLAEDAAVEMARSGGPRVEDALKRGELIRNYVLKVLVKRHRAQGNEEFSVIAPQNATSKATTKTRKNSSNEDFRAAVRQGPFFDKPLLGGRHGVDTHFLQMDYASSVIWEVTNGHPKEFWDFLGSKRGIDYWVALFDSFGGATLARPEYFAHAVSGLLKITD
jgi:hypothetical protein